MNKKKINLNNKLNNIGYFIPKDILNSDDIDDIINDLSIINEDDEDCNFTIYQETVTNKFVLPRYYGIEKFGMPRNIKFSMNEFDRINIEFNGNLRDYQENIINVVKKNLFHSPLILNPFGGGIICIPPGRGKTVIGLYLASIIKYKTLVIVNKDFLLQQWKERIETYTNAKVGIIQRDKIDITGKDIVIGMLQSISMKEYDTEIFKSFPFVIFDECHHLAAKTFSKALKKIQSPYMIGLSATPERKDKLEYVFKYYLGDILYKENITPNNKVLVEFYYFTIKHPKFKTLCNRYSKKFTMNIPGMTNNLVEIKERNDYIINILNSILINENSRKILLLSGRVSHCEELMKILKQNEDYVDDVGLYVGGMKKTQLKISEEKKIILGTYEMAQEALDIQDLDTLVLATPLKGNMNQTIGRILRKEVKDYINSPKIIDIVDNIKYFELQSKNRYGYYLSNEYNVDFFKHDKNFNIEKTNEFITPSKKFDKFEKQSNDEEYNFDEDI
jgi:superfamily II DNA or RNA helicase